MYAFGFSLNNLSLFGLVLSIGIVVDDAIVVVENVERHMANGLPPREAAHKAMDEVSTALIAIALALASVFVPAAFVSGLVGAFYREFALTIAVSTLISCFVSLTLSPALCASFLPKRGARRDPATWLVDMLLGPFFKLFNRFFKITTTAYVKVVSDYCAYRSSCSSLRRTPLPDGGLFQVDPHRVYAGPGQGHASRRRAAT